MTALFGTGCSGWTLWLRYEQRSLIVGLRHRQLFVHNLPVSATVPYAPNETSDLRQNWTLCDHRTSPLRITFELLSLEPRGCLHMHAYGKSNTHCRCRVHNGEHAWDYVIISWRHNLGATFLCSRNVQCSMNVEDCVISKICNGNSIMVNTVMLENYKVNCWDIWLLCNLIIICNGNSIMVNTVMLENYKVNCWDIWLLCNIDGTGPLCLARPSL